MLACLLGLTTYCKSLPALILRVLHHALSQNGSRIAVNREQFPSLMVTTRTETTCGLMYSVSKAIEVTAWQSDDAVCLCCLTHGSCHLLSLCVARLLGLAMRHYLSLDADLFRLQRWGLLVAHAKKTAFISPCHLHMTCSMYWTSLCAACFS